MAESRRGVKRRKFHLVKTQKRQTNIAWKLPPGVIVSENEDKKLMAATDGGGILLCLKQPAVKTIKAKSPKTTLRYFAGCLLGPLGIIWTDFTSLLIQTQ